MNAWTYRLLVGATAGLLAGVAGAQTPTPSSNATTDQGTPPSMQTPTGAAHASHPAARTSHSGMAKSKHATHHASKSWSGTEHTAMQGDEKQYRDALRQCVKERQETLRDSCLDEAIDHYHRNG